MSSWILHLVLAAVSFQTQTPAHEALLRRSDVGGFVPASFRTHLVMQQDGMAAPSEIELWRSGADRTLVRFLDPKERGKYLLRLGADLWFIAPGAKNPVRMSPAHRVYGAATLDVLLGTHLAEDYRIVAATTQPSQAGPVTVFELRAKSAQQQFPTVRYIVHDGSERPVSALYRLQSGKDATLIEFFDWSGGSRGQSYARRIQVHDLLRKNSVTRIETRAFEERQVPSGLFDLHDPTARRQLEKAGGTQFQSLRKQNH